jgi:toxin-antitoxin system PIN domain toxin
LLYASDRASPRHEAAPRFLEERASDPHIFCLAWATLIASVRISTYPTIFAEPLAPAEALNNVEALMRLPRVRAIGEGDGFLAAYREATEGVVARGNLVPDAHLATLLRQHGVRRLYTNDADFRKFPFLEVRDPFS